MKKPLFFPLPGNEELAASLARELDAEVGYLEMRHFPDGETYLRFHGDLTDRKVVLVCTLVRPDEKFLCLSYAASTVRELGAKQIGIVAPYLAYMRQDIRFMEGEAVTSRYFAALLSEAFDWLLTVDPHLHRYDSLDEIYTIPTRVVHSAPLLAEWIKAEIEKPLLIGPDSESRQWVGAVAEQVGAPYLVLEKNRLGDHAVEISVPDMASWPDRTPVLLDDIVSTARTMIEAVSHLQNMKAKAPVCVAVHAIFAEQAYQELMAAGTAAVVSTNAIAHSSNRIDLTASLAAEIGALLVKQ